MQSDGAGLGYFFPFVKALMLADQNAFRNVGIGLPAVCWMSFLDVDNKELDPVLVLVIKAFHVLNLSTEWGSSVAAEYQGYRLLVFEAG